MASDIYCRLIGSCLAIILCAGLLLLMPGEVASQSTPQSTPQSTSRSMEQSMSRTTGQSMSHDTPRYDLSRIVSIGSAVTETIYALGAGDNLVAVDESSLYPEAAALLPKVPFTRNLSAEGVLSMRPTLIVASDDAGPGPVIRQIRQTGVSIVMLPSDESVEGATARVEKLGEVLNRRAEANEIVGRMREELARAESLRREVDSPPTVLFIYAHSPTAMMIAGLETSAATMIGLAGGRNAFDSFSGYRPLTAEAVVAANPDFILMMNRGMQLIGGVEGILKTPGVGLTSAAKNNRIHAMDGNYLLGFGPRMGTAVLDLMKILHPAMEVASEEGE